MSHVDELLDSLNSSQLKQIILRLAASDRQICLKVEERISKQKDVQSQKTSKSPQKPKQKPIVVGPFDTVPTELIFHILSYLPSYELGAAGRVCREWRTIVNNHHSWKSFCVKLSQSDNWLLIHNTLKQNDNKKWKNLYYKIVRKKQNCLECGYCKCLYFPTQHCDIAVCKDCFIFKYNSPHISRKHLIRKCIQLRSFEKEMRRTDKIPLPESLPPIPYNPPYDIGDFHLLLYVVENLLHKKQLEQIQFVPENYLAEFVRAGLRVVLQHEESFHRLWAYSLLYECYTKFTRFGLKYENLKKGKNNQLQIQEFVRSVHAYTISIRFKIFATFFLNERDED